MLIVIIFGGVRSGIFTATESSCIAVLYALPSPCWSIVRSTGVSSSIRCWGRSAPRRWCCSSLALPLHLPG